MSRPDRGALGGAALASGAAVAWSNAALPRLTHEFGLGRAGRSAATAAFCAADALLARARVPAPLGVGAGAALAVAGLIGARSVDREDPPPLPRWVLLDIPLGTVLPEEVLFRGSLTPRWEAALGRPAGSVAGALTFGLWHVGAAQAAGDPVLPTIAVTSFAGAAFDALVRRTRRLWPAMAAHWALNGAGAVLSSG
ncbi:MULTISPECIES: CPBP family intramembrane glutamic endopeptidase [Tsukamurella]|uniref:CPBP family intramembrane metalloprotease n=1 Tax=Tsukamurella strandjordii TaxID=147577 RepID=A0AA90NFA6_9ACTN|nr:MULTISPECIES: CPBP family intramembrane glutamic endopeptidase [Tsukamurella]MDP0397316.1 CPBP family intramembrane metalloprotease [Tsukamurella strandjordii]GIZ98745.1 hypothetical protein TTY48_33570 [Tsukamurella sp. TY48]